MKSVVLNVFLLVILLIPKSLLAQDQSIWVSVLINDKGNMGASEYVGLLKRSEFDLFMINKNPNQLLHLSSVFWYDDGNNVVFMKEAEKYGIKYGYGDSVYFKSGQVLRLVPMDEDVILSNFESKSLNVINYPNKNKYNDNCSTEPGLGDYFKNIFK